VPSIDVYVWRDVHDPMRVNIGGDDKGGVGFFVAMTGVDADIAAIMGLEGSDLVDFLDRIPPDGRKILIEPLNLVIKKI
jgi:hypothetical protein